MAPCPAGLRRVLDRDSQMVPGATGERGRSGSVGGASKGAKAEEFLRLSLHTGGRWEGHRRKQSCVDPIA